MRKILTITIPSYNVENTLSTTLDSIIKSKWIKSLDVIVVDDGSSDGTSKIANKFVKKFPESVRCISKENGGHGSAINTGIGLANGEYFKVVDGDDWLDTSHLDQLVGVLSDSKTDAFYNAYWYHDEKNGKEKLKNERPEAVTARKEYQVDSGKFKEIPAMHALTIRTCILKENNISIDENMFYVDVEYIVYPMPFIETVSFLDYPVYVYRINTGTQSISTESFVKNRNMHMHVITQINEYIRQKKDIVSDVKFEIMVDRLSKMIATQFKILSTMPVDQNTYNAILSFSQVVKKDLFFNVNSINLPIKFLIFSRYRTYPIIHFLARFKARFIRWI